MQIHRLDAHTMSAVFCHLDTLWPLGFMIETPYLGILVSQYTKTTVAQLAEDSLQGLLTCAATRAAMRMPHTDLLPVSDSLHRSVQIDSLPSDYPGTHRQVPPDPLSSFGAYEKQLFQSIKLPEKKEELP
jgi:hypothetical protein